MSDDTSREPSQDELYQQVTDICFENGGVTKPMVDKVMRLIADRERQAEKNGVAWTIGVIDDVHTHTDADLNSHDDKIFKGIKNTIRDTYKFITGTDPAPSYPIKATLTNQKDGEA